jgi:hypothetical protein
MTKALVLLLLSARAFAQTCPADLAVDMKTRTIDTRKHRDLDEKKYNKMKWAPGHRVTPLANFTRGDEIDRVLKAEAANPGMVPAGYRAELAAKPRDASLRLAMARCEAKQPATRRRASYDAAMALLLGASINDVRGVLDETTHDEGANHNTSKSCGDTGSCGKGDICMGEECLGPMGVGVIYISKAELEVEDALVRALWGRYIAVNGTAYNTRDPLYWFLDRRVHRCGAQICGMVGYEKGGKSEMVSWDRRDGGTVHVVPYSEWSSDEKKRFKQRLKCWNATGTQLKAHCLQLCNLYDRGEECRMKCYQSCEI